DPRDPPLTLNQNWLIPRCRQRSISRPKNFNGVMLVYHSRFLTRGEVWFDDEPDDSPVDWIYYRQRSEPIYRARQKYTVLIDLTKSPEKLLSEMDERTVRKIEEAEQKDSTCWERCDANDAKTMDAIEAMWNHSAATLNSTPLDRAWLEKL